MLKNKKIGASSAKFFQKKEDSLLKIVPNCEYYEHEHMLHLSIEHFGDVGFLVAD